MLLSAYEQGIFPWYNADEPIVWQSPDPRFVLYPDKLHVSKSMEKLLRQGIFTVTIDKAFPEVIQACASAVRPGQNGTWITADMIAAYTEMHRLGYAHSAEAWRDGALAGGCYGIRLSGGGGQGQGRLFCGESMFARQSNASKAAFITLARHLIADGVELIDCQQHTRHLESLGGEEVSRAEYLEIMKRLLV
jgi:leucyl/phenylalanyl-tRNA--protein transferase